MIVELDTAIEAFLKANGEYVLTVSFDGDEFVAALSKRVHRSIAIDFLGTGNTPTQAINQLATKLGAFPGTKL